MFVTSPENPEEVLRAQVTIPELEMAVQVRLATNHSHLVTSLAKHSRWQLNKNGRAYLRAHGIGYDPNAHGTHSHPVSKTISTFILTADLPPLLRRDCTVMFLKKRKFETLERNVGQGVKLTLVNYQVTPKDMFRYPDGVSCPISPIETPMCYIDEALHYMSPADVVSLFESSPLLDTLLATVVLPPELMFGIRSGSCPAYSFEVKEDVIQYAPDGVWSESYSQPMSGLWCLETGLLQGANVTVCITSLRQIGSTHLLLVTRKAFPGVQDTHVQITGKTLLPKGHHAHNPVLVNQDLLHDTLEYALSVKSVTVTQVRAKLRRAAQERPGLAMSDSDGYAIAQYVTHLVERLQHQPGEYPDQASWLRPFTHLRPSAWARALLAPLDTQIYEEIRTALNSPVAHVRCNNQRTVLHAYAGKTPAFGGTCTYTYKNSWYAGWQARFAPYELAHFNNVDSLCSLDSIPQPRPAVSPAVAWAFKAFILWACLLLLLLWPRIIQAAFYLLWLAAQNVFSLSPWQLIVSTATTLAIMGDVAVCLQLVQLLGTGIRWNIITRPAVRLTYLWDHVLVPDLPLLAAVDRVVRALTLRAEYEYPVRGWSEMSFGSNDSRSVTPFSQEVDLISLEESEDTPAHPEPLRPMYPGNNPAPGPSASRQPERMSNMSCYQVLTAYYPHVALEDNGWAADDQIFVQSRLALPAQPAYPGAQMLSQTDQLFLDLCGNPYCRIYPTSEHPVNVDHQRVRSFNGGILLLTAEWPDFGPKPKDWQSGGPTNDTLCWCIAELLGTSIEEARRQIAVWIDAGAFDGDSKRALISSLKSGRSSRCGPVLIVAAAQMGSTFRVSDMDYTFYTTLGGNCIDLKYDGEWHYSQNSANKSRKKLHALAARLPEVPADYTKGSHPVTEGKGKSRAPSSAEEAQSSAVNQVALRKAPWLGTQENKEAGQLSVLAADPYDALIDYEHGLDQLVTEADAEAEALEAYLGADSGTGMCLPEAVAELCGITTEQVVDLLHKNGVTPNMDTFRSNPNPLGRRALEVLCLELKVCFDVRAPGSVFTIGNTGPSHTLLFDDAHWSAAAHIATGSNLLSKLLANVSNYTQKFRPSPKRASNGLDAIRKDGMGVYAKRPSFESKLLGIKGQLDAKIPRGAVTIGGLLGEPGTGKSHGFQHILSTANTHNEARVELGDVTVIVPTTGLRQEWKDKIGQTSHTAVRTWEHGLIHHVGSVIIFDEIGLMPPLLDLYLFAHPHITHVFFTGDTAQPSFSPSQYAAIAKRHPSNLDIVGKFACEYLHFQRRLAIGMSQSLSASGHNNHNGNLTFGRRVPSNCTALTFNSARAANMSDYRASFTVSGSQGQTFHNHVCLILDKPCLTATDELVYVALTRGTRGLTLVLDGITVEDLETRATSKLLFYAVVAARNPDSTALGTAIREHVDGSIPAHIANPETCPPCTRPGLPLLGFGKRKDPHWHMSNKEDTHRKALLVGSRMRVADNTEPARRGDSYWYNVDHSEQLEIAVEAVPALNTVLPTVAFHDLPTPSFPTEELPVEAPMPITFDFGSVPISPDLIIDDPDARDLAVDLFFRDPYKANRERVFRGQTTEQVNLGSKAASLYVRHRNQDTATVNWTFHERTILPTRSPTRFTISGLTLFMAFESTFMRAKDYLWDEGLFEECLLESLGPIAEKGPQYHVANSDKVDGTNDPLALQIFLKVQSVTKMNLVFADAKKGQMITGLQTVWNVTLGAVARYLAHWMLAEMPTNVVLNSGLDHNELEQKINAAVNAGAGHKGSERLFFNHDFTGWDGQANQCYLTAWLALLSRLNVPEPLVEAVSMVLANSTMFGSATGYMLPSGWPFTWWLNTWDNLASMALRYELPNLHAHPEIMCLAAGDDCTLLVPTNLLTHGRTQLRERHGFKLIKNRISVDGKGYVSEYGEFCSQIYAKGHLFAEPLNHLGRTLYRAALGDLFICAPAYAEHCYHLERHIEVISPALSENQLLAHRQNLLTLRRCLARMGLQSAGSFLIKGVQHYYDLGELEGDTSPISASSLSKLQRALRVKNTTLLTTQ